MDFLVRFFTPRPVLQRRRNSADGRPVRSFWHTGSCAALGIAGRRANRSGYGSAVVNGAVARRDLPAVTEPDAAFGDTGITALEQRP